MIWHAINKETPNSPQATKPDPGTMTQRKTIAPTLDATHRKNRKKMAKDLPHTDKTFDYQRTENPSRTNLNRGIRLKSKTTHVE
jgi:hypothetical protein